MAGAPAPSGKTGGVGRGAFAWLLMVATAGCGGTPGTAIVALAFSSDGRWLAVAQADGCVSAVELAATTRRQLRVGGSDPHIALTEDGSRLAVAAEGSVTVWSLALGRRERQLGAGLGQNLSLKLSDAPEPFLLAGFDSAGGGDNLKIWRLSDNVLIGSLAGSPRATFTFADEAVLLLSEADRAYQVASFSGRILRQAMFPQPLGRTAFAADGAFLAGVIGAGTDQERIAIMSVADDAFVWQSTEPNRGTRQLLFLENPSRVVQLGDRVIVYDHADGKALTALPALTTARLAVASPDGGAIAAVGGNGTVVMVSSEDGRERPVDWGGGCGP